MDTLRPCSCDGNNENCYKCDGTGFDQRKISRYTLSLGNLPNITTPTQPIPRRKVKARSKKLGDLKNISKAQGNYPRRTRKTIILQEPKAAPRSSILEIVPHSLCRYCGYLIPAERFGEHEIICLKLAEKKRLLSVRKTPKLLANKETKTQVFPKTTTTFFRQTRAENNAFVKGSRKSAPPPQSRPVQPNMLNSSAKGRLIEAQCDSKATELSRMASTLSTYVECEVCGCKLAIKNVGRHLAKAHKNLVDDNFAKPKTTRNTESDLKTRDCMLQNTHVMPTQSGDDIGRDASKYIGHFARDHGSFGSMPSYDDYGDESAPD
jgi:hypothetical protein